MTLCKYKDIFGKPKQGFHSLRIPLLDLALWDTVGTILIIFIIAYLTKVDLLLVSLFVLGLTVFLHALFCVPNNLEKYLWIILLFLGFWGAIIKLKN